MEKQNVDTAPPQTSTGFWLTQEAVQLLLRPHNERLSELVLTCNQKLRQLAAGAPDVYMDLGPGAISTVFNDLVCKEVQRRCADVPGLEVKKAHGRRLLVVEGKLCLRFKKVDENDRASNIRTKRQKWLYGQPIVQLSLDQSVVPNRTVPVLNLTLGWLFDATRTRIEDIRIVFGPQNRLNFSIKDGTASLAIAEFTPVVPASTETSTKKARAVSRQAKQKEAEDKQAEAQNSGQAN
jgi:hypothetical protein